MEKLEPGNEVGAHSVIAAAEDQEALVVAHLYIQVMPVINNPTPPIGKGRGQGCGHKTHRKWRSCAGYQYTLLDIEHIISYVYKRRLDPQFHNI